MDLSSRLFLLLLACVAVERIMELRISSRHQRALARQGIRKRIDPHYGWMVFLHGGVLAGAAAEVLIARRPFIPPLAMAMSLLFVLATLLRWWAIRTLGVHWNVEIMQSASVGVVTTGPFRWIRHPNYLGVSVEIVALPLIHTAWITAILAAVINAWVLRNRIRLEEASLNAEPAYRIAMSGKARFIPGLF